MTNPRTDEPENGILLVQDKRNSEGVSLLFAPTSTALSISHKPGDTAPVLIAEIDYPADKLKIYPIKTLPTSNFLEPKHGRIRCIQLPLSAIEWEPDIGDPTEVFNGLPRGFTRNFQYGLGVPLEYKTILQSIEEHTECTVLEISKDTETRVDNDVFIISMNDWEQLRTELDRITGRAQAAAYRVKQSSVHNMLLTPALGLDPVDYKRGRHPVVRHIADSAANETPLEPEEISDLLDLAADSYSSIGRRQPDVLLKARLDLEVATLDAIIDKYAELLEKERTTEGYWQRFFRENPFALHLAFGVPVLLVQEQASVGGRRLSGKGDKITDFLMKNALTNNAALFEIKRPSTPLLQQRSYREGVYGPSKELGGSLAQVLDQKYQLEKSLGNLKDNSEVRPLEQYSIRGCLIIGRSPSQTEQIKSFEIFRANSTNVDIVTYDELLEKLKQLRAALSET